MSAATGTTVLAADIGGTHTRLGLAAAGAGHLRWLLREKHLNADHSGFDSLLAQFASRAPAAPEAACLAVAGPTDGEHARFTNLDWRITATGVGARLGGIPARLVNDFSAAARALPTLQPDELAVLQDMPAIPDAPRLLLGAGTGLGAAALLPLGNDWRALPGEGGHAGLAPSDTRQVELWQHLHARYGHVSWERVLSGAGLVNLYRFLAGADAPGEPPAPPQLVAAANDGSDPVARHAAEWFAALYGAFAGNLALTLAPRGGVFIGGGLAPRLQPFLQRHFIPSFRATGRFSEWMAQFPVAVVLADDLGMRGAAMTAATLASGGGHG